MGQSGMFGFFLLGIALVAGFAMLARVFVSADPRTLATAVRYGGIALAAVTVVVLTLTGRLGTAMMLGALAFPLLTRWRTLRDAFRPSSYGASSGSGQSSQIETLYLRMTLQHDTGAMAGEVLHGPWRGRTLESLTLGQLLALLDECRRDDAQSSSVLEAWLDRAHPDWQAAEEQSAGRANDAGSAGGGGGRGGGSMTRDEAYEILGLSPGATPEQVKDAHRRLMMKVHPDHGGSTYLAAKINQAKDLLLRN
ncbi:DnaJ domain-containing protein [Azospirillum argentinense]|uniref:Molecular chaperone DnaJ n=2 Tax=Azospirillum TaxID=191 RepID=A0A4D8QF11_AZOBR|nr:DnaJ domain-containing protein [Azospirillum argentinense]QCN99046.1 molecular chaperone DnaJ [Azospirillum argentinense]QCO06760.1 molecular chaperone DnaJ [Azospirillum argentinense]